MRASWSMATARAPEVPMSSPINDMSDNANAHPGAGKPRRRATPVTNVLSLRGTQRPDANSRHVVRHPVIRWKNEADLDLGAYSQNFRSGTDRFEAFWTKGRRVRDRDPVPPVRSVLYGRLCWMRQLH